jgi:hypothetical protein
MPCGMDRSASCITVLQRLSHLLRMIWRASMRGGLLCQELEEHAECMHWGVLRNALGCSTGDS